ncbi:hypothetical protein A7A09_011620 [Paracoccus methylarcula]|uniref:RHS repeat protein n=2 Tax=Paracoccus methylarcula TaxID=72022 RepID=A0A422QX14_9RHOB|nr:hypothetical protein A7A09_011620 [Paracoccus methylarcula]
MTLGFTMPTEGAPHGSTPQMQEAIASQPDARNALERNWDTALDVLENPTIQYSAMAVGTGAAMVQGGMGVAAAATAAGTTATAGTVAIGTLAPLAPIAAGVAGGLLGNWAGGHIGNWVGSAMGLEPLAGPSEQPAVVGDKIYHARSGLVAGLLGAAVAVGAAVAIGAFVLATGGAGLLAVAAFSFAGAGVAGTLFGMAGSLGQQGEEKGHISVGSPDVFFENKAVAHVSAFIKCDDHGPEKQCAQGSDTVYVNGFPLSRKGHKTTCDGTIQTGRETIKLDMTTSADQLDIDGGWLNRIVRTGVAISDYLPFPRGSKPRPGDSTPPKPRPGDSTPASPRKPTQSAESDGINTNAQNRVGDPVDVASGQVSEFRTDITIPGTIPLHLDRSYRRGATGIQGNDWSGTWAQHLRIEAGRTIWQDPDGVEFTFDTPDDNVWAVNLRCPHIALLGSRSGLMYLYDYRSQLFTIFNHRVKNRLLLSAIQDRNGNEITFHYGEDGLKSVNHSDGFGLAVDSRRMLIHHAALIGHDAGDCVFTWQYDRTGRLTRVDSAQTGQLRYGYDEQGRLNMWADSHLTHAHFAYDRADRVIRNWSDSGHLSVELAYDTVARRTRVTDAAGGVRFFDWTDRGLVWREIDAAGGEWLTEWGTASEIRARQDPLGNRWTFDYNGVGDLTRATDPEGNSESWEYNAARLPVAHVDATGSRTAFRHDSNGNLVAVIDPTGAERLYRRDGQGKIMRVELPQMRQTRIYYDAMNRPCRLQTPSGETIRLTHDTEGRLIRQIDEIGAETRLDHTRSSQNPRGALARVTLPDGTAIDTTYDSEGLVTVARNGVGDAHRFRYGAFDLPLESQDPQGNRVRFEHDHALRLTAVINEMGQRYELTYDPVGNLVAERDYSGLITRYDYDIAGRVSRRIAPDGVISQYTWSPAGRLVQVEVVDGGKTAVTTSEFDAAGRLIEVRNDDGVVTRSYDSAGRMISETVNGREMSYSYEPGSAAPVARGGDGLGLEMAYSLDGALSAMRFAGTELSFELDARGLEIQRRTTGGFTHEQDWEVMRRLTGQLVGPEPMNGRPSAARIQRGYGWDRAGRVTSIADRVSGVTEINYDARALSPTPPGSARMARPRSCIVMITIPTGTLPG